MPSALDVAPPVHRVTEDTHSIDRSIFRKSVPVLAAHVPAAKAGLLLKAPALKRSILKLSKTRSVVPDSEDGSGRLVLLKVQRKDDLPSEAIEFLESEGAALLTHNLSFSYEYWTVDEILQAILPEELCDGSPTSFSVTGHLAHLNLREQYLPFKKIIGQTIVDKVSKIRTVVNKLDTIHSQFRFFDMELIAGEPDFVVEHLESDCRFTFDFREVYWNSRLHTEHERLVQRFEPDDGIVADVMAGVGPFAVPAAKKGCAVIANDLNPNSAKWLRKNVLDNNVAENLRVYCEDGREFIRTSLRRALDEPFPPYAGKKASKRQQKEDRRERQGGVKKDDRHRSPSESPLPARHMRNRIAHFVMNLPDTAIEFLDAFRGILTTSGRELSGLYDVMPMVHCHCFTRYLDPGEAEADIRKRVETALGGELEKEASLHLVRSVAPSKDMYCISFRLPRRVAYA